MFEQMRVRSFFLWMVIGIVLLFIGGFIYGEPSDENLDLLMSYYLLGLVPLLWFLWQFKKQGKTNVSIIKFKGVKSHIGEIIYLVIVSIALSLGVFWLTEYALSFFFPHFVENTLQDEMPMPHNKVKYVLLLLNICIFGPIAEEFMFRGLLVNRFIYKWNVTAGILVANILFGILHADIVGATLFGIIQSVLYLRTRNLLVPILIHIINNTFLSLMPYTPDFINYMTIAELKERMIPNLIVFVIAAVLFVLWLKKNWYVFREEKKKKQELKITLQHDKSLSS
ncbi:hypothetical protein CN918_27980 [Priestia megaterium]|nr:hypothetical protein CN918_27980 [Priestia megaterium]